MRDESVLSWGGTGREMDGWGSQYKIAMYCLGGRGGELGLLPNHRQTPGYARNPYNITLFQQLRLKPKSEAFFHDTHPC